jgi:hypothetical protein
MSRMSENVGASTSRNPKGLHGLYRDNFTLPRLSSKISGPEMGLALSIGRNRVGFT